MAAFDGKIQIAWGDGEHVFRLAIPQLLELEEKCNAGAIEILNRLMASRWRTNDVREVIRLGLIGGGKDPVTAHAHTIRYVDERPLLESVPPAIAILGTALHGPVLEDSGEAGLRKANAQVKKKTSRRNLTPPASTQPQPSSASASETSPK